MEKSVNLSAVLGARLKNVISEEGTYTLKAVSIGHDPKRNRTIITLGGMTDYHKRQVAGKLRPHGSIEDVPEQELQDAINKHSATYSFPTDMDGFLTPAKGDLVKATFQFKSIEGSATPALFCTSISAVPVAIANVSSIDDLFGAEEVVEEAKSEAEQVAEEL